VTTRYLCDRRDILRQGSFGLIGATLLADSASPQTSGNGGLKQARRDYIDAHVHIWTNDVAGYAMAPGVKMSEIKPLTFLPVSLLRRARPSGVNRIVLVQMSYYGFDNSYMLAAIEQWPTVFKGIAIVDGESRQPDVKMRELARKGVRGFRISQSGGVLAQWLEADGAIKMFRCGTHDGLAMCFLVNPSDLPTLDRQCDKFPDTPVIIDHMARIGMAGPILEPDIRNLCAMARHKQVKVKISAFYALGQKKPPHADLAPLIHRLCEEFGPKRLMWASDCPFQIADETYEDSISLIRDGLDFLSADDKEWILRRTAEESFFL
jgi:predicted TIM-barrel fold metal-dependent hydrolase